MMIMIDIHEKDYQSILNSGHIPYGVVYAIMNGTPLDSIISDIEAARDKDKLCEYPYNRCINIIKKAVGDES